MKKKAYNFTVFIQKGQNGYYIGSVPSLRGCLTQGKTMDELLVNIKEAIELCLEVEGEVSDEHFIGIQKIQVSV